MPYQQGKVSENTNYAAREGRGCSISPLSFQKFPAPERIPRLEAGPPELRLGGGGWGDRPVKQSPCTGEGVARYQLTSQGGDQPKGHKYLNTQVLTVTGTGNTQELDQKCGKARIQKVGKAGGAASPLTLLKMQSPPALVRGWHGPNDPTGSFSQARVGSHVIEALSMYQTWYILLLEESALRQMGPFKKRETHET